MTVAEYFRILRGFLIISVGSFCIVSPLFELISEKSEKRWNKLNKDIDKMLDDLRKEREDLEKELRK